MNHIDVSMKFECAGFQIADIEDQTIIVLLPVMPSVIYDNMTMKFKGNILAGDFPLDSLASRKLKSVTSALILSPGNHWPITP